MSEAKRLAVVEQAQVRDPIIDLIDRAVRDPAVDVNKIEALYSLQERHMAKLAQQAALFAMNQVQREMEPIGKDASNPAFRSKYASYEAIDKALRPIYTAHGFSVTHQTHMNDGKVAVACVIHHANNYGGFTFPALELEASPDTSGSRGGSNRTEVQGVGSVTQYLRRYTLVSAFNVTLTDDDTDDDGEATHRRHVQPQQVQRQEPPPQPKPRNPGVWLDNLFNAINERSGQEEKVSFLLEATKMLNLERMRNLVGSAGWGKKLGELFPPDAEVLRVALDERMKELAGAQAQHAPPPPPEGEGNRPASGTPTSGDEADGEEEPTD